MIGLTYGKYVVRESTRYPCSFALFFFSFFISKLLYIQVRSAWIYPCSIQLSLASFIRSFVIVVVAVVFVVEAVVVRFHSIKKLLKYNLYNIAKIYNIVILICVCARACVCECE